MSLGMQDKYKEKNSRFQLERQVAEDERTAQDMADHAMDVEPPKNGFDAFMRRYGWGILVALVVLLVAIALMVLLRYLYFEGILQLG